MKIFIKTLQGLEGELQKELEQLGGQNIERGNRSVSCEGNLSFLYSANYSLRTALKVFVPIHTFRAKNEQELYNGVKKFDWSQYLDVHRTFAIDHTIFSDYFKHSKFASLKMKDAIVDQLREKLRSRPRVDTENPDIRFNLHAYKDEFTISLDSSEESLNRRGYRPKGHKAPLNEVLAAGMLKLANWTKETPLLDPMCGTGTILIEAAMMALNIPPQYKRQDFGFKTWNNFHPGIWNRVKMEADAKIRKSTIAIRGGDIDKNAVEMANTTLGSLRLKREVIVRQENFAVQSSRGVDGMIVTNPPYGERIGNRVEQLYKDLGDTLKHKFSGYDVWILSSNKRALKQLGLKPSESIELFNGPLRCEFCKYEMYHGSKKN